MEIVTGVILMLTGIFLILLVLLQRGGGGLVSAWDGTSAHSVFGTGRGRVCSRVTAAAAAVWVVLAGISIHILS